MRNDILLHDWMISADGSSLEDHFLESVFFTGNGRMGARGYSALRLTPRPLDTGLFMAGFYDRISADNPLTDFVNLPTPIWMKLSLAGIAPTLHGPVHRELDLRSGLLSFHYILSFGKQTAEVHEQRFFSLARPGLLFQRFEIHGDRERISLSAGVDHSCRNSPIPDDQVQENSETIQMTRLRSFQWDHGVFSAAYATRFTGLHLEQALSFRSIGFCEPELLSAPATEAGLCFKGCPGSGLLVLEEAAWLTTSRDRDPLLSLGPDSDWSFDAALDENRAAWAEKWACCDVVIRGDDHTQTAVRYTIYQLIANCSPRDDTVSIGARGLTHARYKGCCFWDTDLFLAPFYQLVDPVAAKSLVGYRINHLPHAREHAQRMNSAGARYPWMASFDGTEQCESWDIGCSEVHVTADVAYSVGQYLEWIGDDDLFFLGGAALLVETARFWVSRYTLAPDGTGVNLLFCKGPDEYCGITSNNLYTNMMARHNLSLAVSAATRLHKEDPLQYSALGLSPEETAAWDELSAAIPLPKDPATGRYRQDDTFHLLEPVDPTTLKNGDEASYRTVCFDRVQRYRVIKQADVLLLMTRLPQCFTAEERLAAWEDFEPLCLHDSSLSFATHALFAAQNGLPDAAERYWNKALYLDLRNIMDNTGKEGLHLACLGETWQALVFGFAGLHFIEGQPTLSPHLPSQWESLCFPFQYHGKHYKAYVSQTDSHIDLLTKSWPQPNRKPLVWM